MKAKNILRNTRNYLVQKSIMNLMPLACFAAILGVKGCVFFLGECAKEETVNGEAVKELTKYMKELMVARQS